MSHGVLTVRPSCPELTVQVLDEVQGGLKRQIQQLGNFLDVVGNGRVVPAVGGVPCQSNGQDDIAYAGMLDMRVVADANQQFRQRPSLHQRLLQIVQLH